MRLNRTKPEGFDNPDCALIPPLVIYQPESLLPEFSKEGRSWQSAPSLTITPNGTLWLVFSGDNATDVIGETTSNYSVACTSKDNGVTWKENVFVVAHEYKVRVSETLIWTAPDGVLWHFWTQAFEYFDGRGGIWAMKCENPDDDNPVFSEPKRICDGFMANNPTVLKNGDWAFPSSIWTFIQTKYHPYPNLEHPNYYVSKDGGKSLTYVGSVEEPKATYTESAIIERNDLSLMIFMRTDDGISQAFSYDEGKTWSKPVDFVLPSPSARFFIYKISDNILLMVTHYDFKGRNNMTALLSYDEGKTWPHRLLLDERKEVSYPNGCVAADGRIHITYDREREGAREILHASFTEKDIKNGKITDDKSFIKRVAIKAGNEK